MENKFLKNNLVFLCSSALGGLLGYGFHFLISRQLSVAQYGELQAVTSIMTITGVFFSAIAYFVIKKSAVLALHNDRIGQVGFVDFARQKFEPLMLVFVVLFLIFLPIAKNWLHLSDYSGLIMVGLSMLFVFYAAFFSNSLQGWNYFFALSITGVAATVAKVISGYVLAIFFPTASAVAASFLISAIIGWLTAKKYFQKKWPQKFNFKKNKEWREKYFSGVSFRKSFSQIVLFSLGLAIVGNLDMLLVKNMASAELSGYYGALSVLGKIILWLNFSIVGVLFPEACSVAYAGQSVSPKTIFSSYGLILIISLPLLIAYYFFPEFFVAAMFGPAYLGVAGSLWLFGAMAFIFSLMLLESKLALARYALKASLVLFLTMIILMGSLFFYHDSLRIIISAVSVSFFCGWVMMLALNLQQRFSSKNKLAFYD